MSTELEQTNDSRRKFIKIAAASAYVAPLIASMPAHATFKSNGSQPVKKVWSKTKSYKRVYRYKRYAYNRFNRYNRYRRYSTRRW